MFLKMETGISQNVFCIVIIEKFLMKVIKPVRNFVKNIYVVQLYTFYFEIAVCTLERR